MNAKIELLEQIKKANSSIKCAEIKKEYIFDKFHTFFLKEKYTQEEMRKFYEDLDFEYDGGYGLQELHGIVWLSDGTWLERREYDGSEWWEHKVCPKIPNNLLTSSPLRADKI